MNLLAKNLEALKKQNETMATWIENQPDEPWIYPIKNSDGTTNILLDVGLGNHVPAYPIDGTLSFEEELYNRLPRTPNIYSVHVGMGCGHRIAEMIENMESGHRIVVVEPVAHFYRLAFSEYDFSKELSASKLIVIRDHADEYHSAMNRLEPSKFTYLPIFTNEHYIKLLDKKYGHISNEFRNYCVSMGNQVNTLRSRGIWISYNQVCCLPRAIRSNGIGTLEGAFEGKPAIIVSAGPSLKYNIDLLKKAKGKAVIIALAQTLRSVLAYDVKPDIVCVVDMTTLFKEHLKGLYSLDDITLMASVSGASDVVQTWQGNYCPAGVFNNASPDHYLRQLWEHKGQLITDASGAHLALRMAITMKADPIVFLGQDLASSGVDSHFHQYRSAATLTHPTIHDCSMEDDGTVPTDPNPVMFPVDGFFGEKVNSSISLIGFLNHFERIIKDHDGQVINATEGGAWIKGAKHMPFSQVLKEYCTEKIDTNINNMLSGKDPLTDGFSVEILRALKRELRNIESFVETASASLESNRKLTKIFNREGEKSIQMKRFKELLSENKKTTEAARAIVENNYVMTDGIMSSYYQAIDLDPTTEEDPMKKLELGLARNKTMLEGGLEGLEILRPAYEHATRLLENYLFAQATLKNNPESPQALSDMAEVLVEMGCMVEGYDYFKQAVEQDPENTSRWELLGKHALTRDKFHETQEIIERLRELEHGHEAADSLQADLDAIVNGLLENAEEDFENDFFIYPLLNARKYLEFRPNDQNAQSILKQAEQLRSESIANAKADYSKKTEVFNSPDTLLDREYRKLVEEASNIGRDDDNVGAMALLKKAVDLDPNRPDAHWGIASTLFRLQRFIESKEKYRILVEKYPSNLRFMFEYGLVLIQLNRHHEGLDQIAKAMEKSKDFDSYLAQMAAHYRQLNLHKKASEAYDRYLESFPADFRVWTARADCMAEMGQLAQAVESYDKALSLKSDYEHALTNKDIVLNMIKNVNGVGSQPTDS